MEGIFTKGYGSLPERLTSRVISPYQAALSEFPGYATSMWDEIDGKKLDIHAALVGADCTSVTRILSDPGTTRLFWGMDPAFPEFIDRTREKPGGISYFICDRILRLGEALALCSSGVLMPVLELLQ
jgi:hypothetical protein